MIKYKFFKIYNVNKEYRKQYTLIPAICFIKEKGYFGDMVYNLQFVFLQFHISLKIVLSAKG